MLHYIGLIVLVFVALVLGVPLSGLVFLEVLGATENLTAAICAALLTFICVVVAAVFLAAMI
jgi:hypothetical protein